MSPTNIGVLACPHGMAALCQRCETEKLWALVAAKDEEIARLRVDVAAWEATSKFYDRMEAAMEAILDGRAFNLEEAQTLARAAMAAK